MNLAQVIHQRWADTAALNDLLPASEVTTGMSLDPSLPYAVVSKQSDRPVERFGDGSALDEIGVRVQVFHDNHDSGSAIVHQIKAAFDRTDFDLSGSDKVINMERSNDFELQQSDGVWRFVVDFCCMVQLATGV